MLIDEMCCKRTKEKANKSYFKIFCEIKKACEKKIKCIKYKTLKYFKNNQFGMLHLNIF